MKGKFSIFLLVLEILFALVYLLNNSYYKKEKKGSAQWTLTKLKLNQFEMLSSLVTRLKVLLL